MTSTDKPCCPVVAFDHHSPEFSADRAAAFRTVKDEGELVYSITYDGFWIPTTYQGVSSVARNPKVFSSARYPADSPYMHVTLPASWEVPLHFIEFDPPEHTAVRRFLNPRMSTKAAEGMRDLVTDVTTYCIDRVIESGECDLVHDLLSPIPSLITLIWMGMEVDDWQRMAEIEHNIVAYPPGTPEFQVAIDGQEWKHGLIRDAIRDRRKNPADDLISYIVNGEIGGEPVSDEAADQIICTIIIGGVDTATSLISQALVYLEDKPDLQKRLCTEPEFLTTATEEFLRYFSPSTTHSRTVTEPVDLDGQQLEPGDRVLLCWAGVNRDPAVFEDPDEVKLDRKPNSHAAFGLSVHKCIGAPLARVEFQAIVPEILRRLPGYSIDRTKAQQYASQGIVSGWANLPATFTPGVREGSGNLPTA
jgi:cytochrome P450